MQLTLSYTARLNLHYMMGQQRGTVDDIRAYWDLQDAVQLDDAERRTINYQSKDSKAEWDGLLGLQAQDFEFTAEQCERMRNVIKTWPQGFGTADRQWLEPLLRQLDPPAHATNGLPKTQPEIAGVKV